MKIKKISIQGFRAFSAKCDMALPSDFGLIYGLNSHGKTSLAEGLEFLFCGKTSRRELIARSKQEYCNALRNVHLPAGQEVFVEIEVATFETGTECVRKIKRILDDDYPAGDSNCTSRLLCENGGGWVPFRFSEIGLPDFDSPESTPIIFQHTLRYVSNTEPSRRREYFRRLLDVNDLYKVREVVRVVRDQLDLQPAIQQQKDALIYAEALSVEFPPLLGALHATPPHKTKLEAALIQLMFALLSEHGTPPSKDTTAEAIAASFRNSITERRTRRFDTRILSLPSLGNGWISTDRWDSIVKPVMIGLANALEKYNKDNAVIDQQIDELKEFYQAGVNLPSFREPFTSPKQCPFCLTNNAVVPERVSELKEILARPVLIQSVRRELTDNLRSLEQLVLKAKGAANDQISPPLNVLNIEEAQVFFEQEQSATYITWWNNLCKIRKCRRRLSQMADFTLKALRALLQRAQRGEDISIGGFDRFEEYFRRECSTFEELIRIYSTCTPDIQHAINDAIDVLDKREQWSQLVHIYDSCDLLCRALIDREARKQVKAEINTAYESISSAVGQVLIEDKYPALSSLVSGWWSTLRPGEPVNFKAIKPQGTGQRHIDIKATISGAAGAADIERDAVAIFSDSQLNCLGLATFLARSSQDNYGVVIFDDPIQSLDKEHEYLFVTRVVDQLLRSGQQVIIFTHSHTMWSDLQTCYSANIPKGFKVEITSLPPTATIVEMDSELGDLLKRADHIVRNPDPGVSLATANQIRTATELFCKLLLCKNLSTATKPVVPSDYEGKMLPELLKKAEPFLAIDPSHAGKIRHIDSCTNRGSHHDHGSDPRLALSAMLGDVRELARSYGLL